MFQEMRNMLQSDIQYVQLIYSGFEKIKVSMQIYYVYVYIQAYTHIFVFIFKAQNNITSYHVIQEAQFSYSIYSKREQSKIIRCSNLLVTKSKFKSRKPAGDFRADFFFLFLYPRSNILLVDLHYIITEPFKMVKLPTTLKLIQI